MMAVNDDKGNAAPLFFVTWLSVGYNTDMDINSLKDPAQPLDNETAREWLREFQRLNPSQGQSVPLWRAVLKKARPNSVPNEGGVEEKILDWIKKNDLWERSGDGYIISMRGVGVILSSDQPRKSPAQAWGVAQDLIMAGRWINQAPVEFAPMRIDDILIFGSMTDPGSDDHGDLDAIVLLSSKASGAYDMAEKELGKLGVSEVLKPRGSSLPSFRAALMQWLADIIPFASLDDQGKTVDVLLGQDPDFSCYSLFGKNWTEHEIEKTTGDEYSYILMNAIENGEKDKLRRQHVNKMLNATAGELPDLDDRMKELGQGMKKSYPKQSWWWENMNSPEVGIEKTRISKTFMEDGRAGKHRITFGGI